MSLRNLVGCVTWLHSCAVHVLQYPHMSDYGPQCRHPMRPQHDKFPTINGGSIGVLCLPGQHMQLVQRSRAVVLAREYRSMFPNFAIGFALGRKPRSPPTRFNIFGFWSADSATQWAKIEGTTSTNPGLDVCGRRVHFHGAPSTRTSLAIGRRERVCPRCRPPCTRFLRTWPWVADATTCCLFGSGSFRSNSTAAHRCSISSAACRWGQ
jgi:hypothetical protein